MANPILAWVSTLYTGTAIAQSGSITATFHMTQGFEAHILCTIAVPNTTGVSAGGQVLVYESGDGGVTFENQATVAAAFPTTANTQLTRMARLTTGQYAVRVMVGGGTATTWSASILTAMIITAYS